jgi:hypothetical protein
MKGRKFKAAVFEQFARISCTLSSPKRLELIDMLAQGERDVGSLAKQVAMPGTAGYHALRLDNGMPEWRTAGLSVDVETVIS